jgi:hypothetical protein
MAYQKAINIQNANHTLYELGQNKGHYESYFMRANHPDEPKAFWIRYTIFSPHGKPHDALAELWAIYFDQEDKPHVAVKTEVPIDQATFSADNFNVCIDNAILDTGHLKGISSMGGHTLQWDMKYKGTADPLFLLPIKLYKTPLPKAKSLVSLPMAYFDGKLNVDDTPISINGWIGSQNHNWGLKHTDYYAWGQVAGFDTHPDSFLEVATARLKFGPLWTPFLTFLVLRHNGVEYKLNTLTKSYRARGGFRYFDWDFSSENSQVKIEGRISAAAEDFVGLRYYNPPGGIKHCLNTKIAGCKLRVTNMAQGGNNTEILETRSRAAFEILTDDTQHGIKLYA